MKRSKIKLSSPKLLEMLHGAALALGLTEFQFKITPEDGFMLNRLDSSKAAHLRIEIPPSDFEEYKVPEEREVCLDMEAFTEVVKRTKRLKEPIEIQVLDDEMHFSNDGTPKRTFQIKLLTPAPENKELNLELETVVIADAKEMHEQVQDLLGIATHAIIEVSDGILTVNGEGDKGKVSVQTQLTDLGLVKSHEGPNAKAMYAMAYLSEAFKFLKDFDVIAMRFADNKPLTLTTIVGNGAIRILVAPRVERR